MRKGLRIERASEGGGRAERPGDVVDLKACGGRCLNARAIVRVRLAIKLGVGDHAYGASVCVRACVRDGGAVPYKRNARLT